MVKTEYLSRGKVTGVRALTKAGVISMMMAVLAISVVTPAVAEGPGYGGNADTLSVSWEPKESTAPETVIPEKATPDVSPSTSDTGSPEPVQSPLPQTPEPTVLETALPDAVIVQSGFLPSFADPQLDLNEYVLQVNGLGFRGKSEIEVRIGSDAPVIARADSAGAMSVQLDADKIGSTLPGVSVMAVGRNQAGTEVALFGSIPPVSSGNGPMTLLPWGAAVILIGWLIMKIRRKFSVRT